jgi:predicted PurR-regulated permease PerM
MSQSMTQERFSDIVVQLQSRVDIVFPGVQVDGIRIAERFGTVLNVIVSSIGSLLGSFASLILNLFLMLLFYYYLVRDGDGMVIRLKNLSPLSDIREDEVLFRIGRAITATVRGSLVLALLQGLVSGLGYIIFGLPSPALWGSVVVFASFIPTVGTALVQVPAILYFILTGHMLQAIGLAIWAALTVGMLDNILGPKLVAQGLRMHPLLTLLAILGGINFFGPLGILLGPITVALLYALLDIYTAMVQTTSHGSATLHRTARGV